MIVLIGDAVERFDEGLGLDNLVHEAPEEEGLDLVTGFLALYEIDSEFLDDLPQVGELQGLLDLQCNFLQDPEQLPELHRLLLVR